MTTTNDLVRQALIACDRIRPIAPGKWPIFRLDWDKKALFYTPGYLALVPLSTADRFEILLTGLANDQEPSPLDQLRNALVQRAKAAVAARKRWQTASFRPECLTLYLSNQCNLRCVYCYANAKPQSVAGLDFRAIQAAARLVAKTCREKNCTFTVVFHGGGEPTLDQSFVEQILSMLDEISDEYEVPIFRYVATNGVMSQRKAIWLAQCFDLVGLSCDGPPAIQNFQRPSWGGTATSHKVEQTARILREQGRQFHIRVTLTQETMHRQVEISDYLCQKLSPTAIHIEPVYQGGRANHAVKFVPADAIDFVAQFLQVRNEAAQYNIPVFYAGSRLDSIHGPYCQIFRNVLNLVPGGVATACFKATTTAQANLSGVTVGSLSEASDQFKIDDQIVKSLQGLLSSNSSFCDQCFNQFHCVGECPDYCALAQTHSARPNTHKPGFRCQIQKLLAMSTLLETAGKLRENDSVAITANGWKAKRR